MEPPRLNRGRERYANGLLTFLADGSQMKHRVKQMNLWCMTALVRGWCLPRPIILEKRET